MYSRYERKAYVVRQKKILLGKLLFRDIVSVTLPPAVFYTCLDHHDCP